VLGRGGDNLDRRVGRTGHDRSRSTQRLEPGHQGITRPAGPSIREAVHTLARSIVNALIWRCVAERFCIISPAAVPIRRDADEESASGL